jgi:acetoin utilization deacetylase AcuC-like enzyme/ankyrin repeat protein
MNVDPSTLRCDPRPREMDSEQQLAVPGPSRYALHECVERGDAEGIDVVLGGLAGGGDAEFQPGQFDRDSDAESIASSTIPSPDVRDGYGRTAVHLAVLLHRAECLKKLLEGGADVSLTLEGTPLLHLVMAVGGMGATGAKFAVEASRLAVEAGARLDETDAALATALHYCAEGGLVEAAKAVEEAATAKASSAQTIPDFILAEPDPHRRAILMEEYGPGEEGASSSSAGWKVDARDVRGRTALHVACEYGHAEFVKWLVEDKGADVDVKDELGDTAAHVAVAHGFEALLRVLLPKMKTAGDKNSSGATIGDVRERFRAGRGKAAKGKVAVVWHLDMFDHRTHPWTTPEGDEARTQRGMRPPPENPERLSVLIHGKYGALHSKKFQTGARRTMEWKEAPVAAMSDVLRVHEFSYVRRVIRACEDALTDTEGLPGYSKPVRSAPVSHEAIDGFPPFTSEPSSVRVLDADTTVSSGSWQAALRAAGASCHAVDLVVEGGYDSAFCPIRPPGHHAGPMGRVVCKNDPTGSLGFCLLNNAAIAAAYARNKYGRSEGPDQVKRVAILDFDIHHGNGTEAAVRNLTPSTISSTIATPFMAAMIETDSYKPWLDHDDGAHTLFISSHGYGHVNASASVAGAQPNGAAVPSASSAAAPTHGGVTGTVASKQVGRHHSWFYPGSGDVSGVGLPDEMQPLFPGGPARSTLETPQEPSALSERDPEGGPYAGRAPPAEAKPTSMPVGATELRGHSLDELAPGGSVRLDKLLASEGSVSWPAVINVGMPRGMKSPDWREVMATKVLPVLAKFAPDLVIISAGFDGHASDEMCEGYGMLWETDYAWVTEQVSRITRRGRVVSLLEGGYAIAAGPISPFARSVAAHVDSLVSATPAPEAAAPCWGWDATAAAAHAAAYRQGRERVKQEREQSERAEEEVALGEDAVAGAAAAAVEEEGYGRDARRKRRRAVDYSKLNDELDAEEEGAPKRVKQGDDDDDGDDEE